MQTSSADLRVRRTRRSLQQALVEVVHERGFGSVTVRELAARAAVNRTTFYRHFPDKETLALSLLDDALRNFAAPLSQAIGAARPFVQAEVVCRLLFDHVERHKRLYRALLLGPQAAWFGAAVRRRLATALHEMRAVADADGIRGGGPTAGAELAAGGMVATLVWWLEQPSDDDPGGPGRGAAQSAAIAFVAWPSGGRAEAPTATRAGARSQHPRQTASRTGRRQPSNDLAAHAAVLDVPADG